MHGVDVQKAHTGAGDEDEDVMLDGATGLLESTFNCGITGGEMTNPKVAPCGHVFSQAGFEHHFRVGAGPKKCPASGCSESYSSAELVDDMRTAAIIKHQQQLNVKRRQQHEEDDIEDASDDDDSFAPAAGSAAAVASADEPKIKREPRRH